MESTLNKQRLAEFYRQMLLIRRFEEACGRLYMQGKIRGFLHLYIGEEAIAVGAISALRPDDYVIGHYRDHGHAIAKGMDPKLRWRSCAASQREAVEARAAQCTFSMLKGTSWAATPL